MSQLLFVIAIIAIIAGIGFIGHQQARKRREGMRQVAIVMGFTFSEGDPGETVVGSSALPIMNRGRRREIKNVLTGRLAEHPVSVMDYSYVTGSGKSSTTHSQSVALFREGGRGLPDFELAPENIFHKIGAVFGYQDIDFPESDAFSSKYLLRGENEEAVRKTFNATTLAFLAEKPGWSVETKGGVIGLFRAERQCKPEEVPTFLADALTIMNGLSRAG